MNSVNAAGVCATIADLPGNQRIWSGGSLTIRDLLTSVAMRRSLAVAKATAAGNYRDAHQIRDGWTHAAGALVEWQAQHAIAAADSTIDQSMVDETIKLALDWQKLETLQLGLSGNDIIVKRTAGRNVWFANKRDPAVEVLDIMLAQVTVPPPDFYAPSLAPVIEWFERNKGRSDKLHDIPSWIHTLMWEWAQLKLATQGSTIPADADIGGLTLAEARSCYALLLGMCQLNELCSVMLETPQTLLWFIRPRALLVMLAGRVGRTAAMNFIAMCTFKVGRTPITAPLVTSGEYVMIPSDLVSATAFERTLLRAAASEPSRTGRLGNLLGRRAARWSERLRTIPGVVVFERVTARRDGALIGDLDVVAYDSAENLALVFETKWPIDAATLVESNKIDAQFNSGREQLRKLRAAISDGGVVHWPQGFDMPHDVEIRWWVGSAQQLDSRVPAKSADIGSTSLRLLEHLLPCQTLRELDNRLQNPPMPREGQDYEVVEHTVKAGRLRLHYPAIGLDPRMPIPPSERRIHNGWT